MGINTKELLWDLLEQWKAIVIFSLIMMILVAGTKYSKDVKAFNDAEKQKAAEATSGITVEEQISKIMEALPEEDRATVEFIINQNEWVETEKEYINNSILMNTNPSNQRTLLLDYYITVDNVSDSIITSLVYSYTGYLSSNNVIDAVGGIIAADKERKYIAELISVNNGIGSNNKGDDRNNVTETDDDAAVMEIRIVLPDGQDASAIEVAIDEALKEYSSEIARKIGPHSIRLIKSSEAYLYNEIAITNRNSVMQNIYNLQNNTKNMQSSLSDEQKSAIETITTIKKENKQNNSSVADATDKNNQNKVGARPGISKKYALIGFLLGACIYSFIYLLYIISKGCVSNSDDVEYYTQSRVLGEVYYASESSMIKKLFHSKTVEAIRYNGKMDANEQKTRAITTIEARCSHAGLNAITLFNMTDDRFARDIINACNAIEVFMVDTDGGFSEKSMLNIDNAIIVVGKDTKVNTLTNLKALCDDYDINVLGSVFCAEL